MSDASTPKQFDEIDWEILRLLAKNPRRPYSDISDELRKLDYEMSSEGIRYRVDKILESMSIFFMLNPNEHDWEVVIFLISVVDEPGATDEVMERTLGDKIWFVSQGFGSFDLYAIATAATNSHIEQIMRKIRGYEQVDNVEYLIETHRQLKISNYFPIRNLN